jgi:hypothetical protein
LYERIVQQTNLRNRQALVSVQIPYFHFGTIAQKSFVKLKLNSPNEPSTSENRREKDPQTIWVKGIVN